MDHVQAFFSARVRSAHEPFILSRNAIQSSACSCGAIPSHLFSMSANMGAETAWPGTLAVLSCRCWAHWGCFIVAAAARGRRVVALMLVRRSGTAVRTRSRDIVREVLVLPQTSLRNC